MLVIANSFYEFDLVNAVTVREYYISCWYANSANLHAVSSAHADTHHIEYIKNRKKKMDLRYYWTVAIADSYQSRSRESCHTRKESILAWLVSNWSTYYQSEAPCIYVVAVKLRIRTTLCYFWPATSTGNPNFRQLFWAIDSPLVSGILLRYSDICFSFMMTDSLLKILFSLHLLSTANNMYANN